MITVKLLSNASVILHNIQRTPTWGSFLEAALRAGYVELLWENHGEYYTNPESGFICYRDLGRKLVRAQFVGPPVEAYRGEEEQQV